MCSEGSERKAIPVHTCSLSGWRATRESVGADRSAAVGRAYFMSFVGVVGSALFLWGIIMFGISAFALNACSQAR